MCLESSMKKANISEVDVITPTFHSEKFINLMIRSFEKFKPSDLKINYIIVENSDDDSYKEKTLALCENITWVPNPTHCLLYTSPSPRDGLLSRMPSSA